MNLYCLVAALLLASQPALARMPEAGGAIAACARGTPAVAIAAFDRHAAGLHETDAWRSLPVADAGRGAPPLNQPLPRGQPDYRDGETAAAPPAPLAPDKRLADLYARLAKATDQDEAQGIAGALERQWLFTTSDTAGLLMTRALGAIQRNELPLALELLDKLTVLEPKWAEAWNKRATVRFMADDYPGSMQDISQVLALDPNHFGALMGMGTILQRSGNDKRALEAYRRAHEVYPALDSVKRVIDTLAPAVDGRDI